ncbi:MAG: hypothetical protein KAR44_15130 [Candidatus Aegiribacteria sp.]|nr:hypothetical protein [Candidatus Aegiribacteria sp.]MCK5609846.1 hypothetical protein [Candidatus Pacearchaeota archaeon]
MAPYIIPFREKRPGEDLDFSIDWDTLEFKGTDTIKTSTWLIDVPGDFTLHNGVFIASPAQTQIWVDGGVIDGGTYVIDGENFYLLTNTITTNNSPERKQIRSIYLKVKIL